MLADAILVLHFAIVAFIVGGLVLIVAGGLARWDWVRNPTFRMLHFAAILFVALESLAGIACPLTVLEDMLRGGGGSESFVGRWVRRLLYYEFPTWMFTVAYVLFAAAVALAWRRWPPRRR